MQFLYRRNDLFCQFRRSYRRYAIRTSQNLHKRMKNHLFRPITNLPAPQSFRLTQAEMKLVSFIYLCLIHFMIEENRKTS